MEIAGATIEGAQNIFFAQLADPNTVHFSTVATRFFSGEFILYIFGFPGAALAMYHCARPEKKKDVYGLLLSASLTSILTGITEPIEFSFLFVAPLLFGISAVFAGLAYAIAHALNIAVGLTFSGGFIDLFLFGILQGNSKTSWFRIIPVGIIYFIVYYFVFRFFIKKLNLKTPGREEDDVETKLYTRADYEKRKGGEKTVDLNNKDELSAVITEGLGGKDNISDVDACATRLRITVLDSDKVNEDILKSTGASGVVTRGNGVQVVYGPRVTVIKSNLDDYLNSYNTNDQLKRKVNEKIIRDKKISEDYTGNKRTDHKKSNNDKFSSDITGDKTANDKTDQTWQTLIYSPISGRVMELKEIGDGVFSEGMLGQGFAVDPMDEKVVAPFDCKVVTVFNTKHAIGLISDNVELLIHIGIDTVKLNGVGFDVKVKEGDILKKGDLIATFDRKLITEAGYSVITPVIITNTDKFKNISLLNKGNLKAGDKVMFVE